jgi:hypothetical protein
MTWLMDALDDNSGAFNMCVPTMTGSGVWQVQQGSNNQTLLSDFGNSWFSFSTWNRISNWMRGGASATGSMSTGFLETLNSAAGLNTFQYGTAAENPLFVDSSPGGQATQFSYLNIPGYTAVANQSQLPLIDDVYVAVGAGSVACVQLGDAPTYIACKHMTRLGTGPSYGNSWSDGEVEATIPRAGLDFTGQAYVYITNANGLTNATGFAA